jgi:uncharacterized protein (DUF4415 family)
MTIEKKVRGLGKKPAKKLVSIRLDNDVYNFFKTQYPARVQATIRAVLTEYVTKHGERNGNNTND